MQIPAHRFLTFCVNVPARGFARGLEDLNEQATQLIPLLEESHLSDCVRFAYGRLRFFTVR
eukprot:8149660-Pyramimonas_sp.AAC.2